MKIIKKIKHIIIFISLIAVIIGLVKVNIINTKALSPLGNTKENYEKIKEDFGDEFSKFINDNAAVKIYKDDKSDNILVRVGENNYKIRKQSYIFDKLESAVKYVDDICDDFYKVIIE